MVLIACGYRISDDKVEKLQAFLEGRKAVKLDFDNFKHALKHLKLLDMAEQDELETDEYLDAYVALGGMPDKSGTISKSRLIEIIKEEFELTIDMVEYLCKIGGDDEEINYEQFCVLLDAGTSGNPSRVSSYLSNNQGSSFMRFSYFINNMDRLTFQ